MAAGRNTCGPICQHPSCWESSMEREREDPFEPTRSKTKEYKWPEADAHDSFPVLTVSDVTPQLSPLPVRPSPSLRTTQNYSSPLFQSCRSCAINSRRHQPNVSFTQFVLEEEGTESLSLAPPNLNDYSFVPVLLWKPHPCSDKRHRGKTPGFSETERGVEGDGKLLLKKTDLSESLPPTISHSTCSPSTTGQNKQRKIIEVKKAKGSSTSTGRRLPSSATNADSIGFMLDKYIVDGLDDVPLHVVNQIIDHLQSQDHVRVLNEAKNPLPSPPPSLPLPLPLPSLPSKPSQSHVPTSLVLDLSTHTLHSTSSPTESVVGGGGARGGASTRKSQRRKGKELSYSRTLARQPSEALSGLKAKINNLQSKANYVMGGASELSKPLTNTSTDSVFQLPSPMHTNDIVHHSKYFSPRLLSKSNALQRHKYRPPVRNLTTPPNKNLLPIFFPGYDKMGRTGMESHTPVAGPVATRQFSEDTFSRPQTHSHTLSARSHSQAPSSGVSSNRGFVGADLASVSGKLLLLNSEGEIVHEVQPHTDTSIPTLKLPDEDEEGREERVETSDSILYPIEGTVAPPPSARGDDVSPSVSNERSGTVTSVIVESD